VKRVFGPGTVELDRIYVGDITYIRTWQGWAYLASVIDLASRRVVGWALADHMRAPLVCDALRMAIRARRPGPGLMFHSDRGSPGRQEARVEQPARRSGDGGGPASQDRQPAPGLPPQDGQKACGRLRRGGGRGLKIANMVRRAKALPDPDQPGAFLPNGGAAKTARCSGRCHQPQSREMPNCELFRPMLP